MIKIFNIMVVINTTIPYRIHIYTKCSWKKKFFIFLFFFNSFFFLLPFDLILKLFNYYLLFIASSFQSSYYYRFSVEEKRKQNQISWWSHLVRWPACCAFVLCKSLRFLFFFFENQNKPRLKTSVYKVLILKEKKKKPFVSSLIKPFSFSWKTSASQFPSIPLFTFIFLF